MEILTDSFGTKWELISLSENRVQLRARGDWDNFNTYSRTFIENAIESGLLERLPVKEEGGDEG